MDYEKKYNEVLERAQKATRAGSDVAMDIVQYIFPELAESEDERMCKRCIELLRKVSAYSGEEYLGVEIADCIIGLQALMKKQKEPVVDKEGMYYYLGGEFIYCGYPAIEENPYDFAISQQEKQKESLHISETCKEKPNSFTDKDEKMLERVLESLTCYRSKVYDEGEGELAREIDEEIDWVQAWKEQKKPNARQRLAEWSKTEEGKAKYEEVAKEMRKEMEKEQKPIMDTTEFEKALADVIVSSQGLGTYEACKDVAREETPLLISKLKQEQKPVELETLSFSANGKECVIIPKEEYEALKKPVEWTYPYGKNKTVDNLISIAECLEMDGDCSFNGMLGEDCGKFLRGLARKEAMQKPEERFEAAREKYQVEWSEEDMTMLNNLIWSVHMKSISPLDEMDDRGKYERYENFLRSFPKRFSPQPKQEWTEEEKQKLNRIYSIIGWAMDEHAFSSCKKLIGDKEGVELQDFLRSVAKPEQQSQWKPSEEQMNGFHTVLYQPQYISNSDDERLKQAESLYNDLKKLM